MLQALSQSLYSQPSSMVSASAKAGKFSGVSRHFGTAAQAAVDRGGLAKSPWQGIRSKIKSVARWAITQWKLAKHHGSLFPVYAATGLYQAVGFIPGSRAWLESLFILGKRPKAAKLADAPPELAGLIQEHRFDGPVSKTSKNRMYGWYVPPKANRSTILITPGRQKELGYYNQLISNFAKKGYGVFIYELRSYGNNKGRFSEAATTQDLLAASQYLEAHLGVPAKKQVAFGWSLGGAITANAAAQKRFRAVVLSSTFTQLNAMVEVIKELFGIPKEWFKNQKLTQPFDTLENVKHFKDPTLFLHGQGDTEIPYVFAEQLYRQCGLKNGSKQIETFARHPNEPHFINPALVVDKVDRFLRLRYLA